MIEQMHDQILQTIVAHLDYKKMISHDDHPKEYQYVVTGSQMGGGLRRRVGYCVQVRKGVGDFGSDQVFLRHPDGALSVHENQFYVPLSDEEIAQVASLFKVKPEDEDVSQGYVCYELKRECVGFLIEGLESSSSSNHPVVMIAIESKDSLDITAII